MYNWVRNLLRCPSCDGDLNLTSFAETGDRVCDGVFVCAECTDHFFVIEGIPRFVDHEILATHSSYENFLDEYGDELTEATGGLSDLERAVVDRGVKTDTDAEFGYQWDRWKRWGWLDEGEVPQDDPAYKSATMAETAQDFETKSLFTPDELKTGVTLDAGCGNGRFTWQAAKHGRVVGVDLGTPTVEAAHENCRDKDNIQIIQADLFQLPFANHAFSTIYSIGVLQHTGDARKAFESLIGHLKPGGRITAHVYHPTNPVFEFVDHCLRFVTTKLSREKRLLLSRGLAWIGSTLYSVHPYLLIAANQILRLKPTVIQMFDWYSAPVATRHTYGEVLTWFTENDLVVAETNMKANYGFGFRLVYRPGTATVKGVKNQDAKDG